jgi:hypothetical protein
MSKDMMTVKGFKNKVAILFYPPGWFPTELGGQRLVPEVTKDNYRKFDIVVPKTLQSYLFVHFLSLLAATAFFLFTYTSNSLAVNLSWASAIAYSIISLGLLFESRKFAWFLELFRLIALILLSSFLLNDWLKYLGDVYLFSSFIMIFKCRNLLTR